MNLSFYKNSGDIRQLSKDLTTVKSNVSAQITYQVSIQDPTFILVYDAALINANYVYVEEWDRYYYINNKNILDGNTMELQCHIDVLMSYRNEILNSDCIASRSASNTNPYIIDDLVGDEGTFTTTYQRSSVTPFNNTGSYLLTVAGK